LKRKEVLRHSTDLHVSTLMWRPRLVPGAVSSRSQSPDCSMFQITSSALVRGNVKWSGLKKCHFLLWAKMLFKKVSRWLSAENVYSGWKLAFSRWHWVYDIIC